MSKKTDGQFLSLPYKGWTILINLFIAVCFSALTVLIPPCFFLALFLMTFAIGIQYEVYWLVLVNIYFLACGIFFSISGYLVSLTIGIYKVSAGSRAYEGDIGIWIAVSLLFLVVAVLQLVLFFLTRRVFMSISKKREEEKPQENEIETTSRLIPCSGSAPPLHLENNADFSMKV